MDVNLSKLLDTVKDGEATNNGVLSASMDVMPYKVPMVSCVQWV